MSFQYAGQERSGDTTAENGGVTGASGSVMLTNQIGEHRSSGSSALAPSNWAKVKAAITAEAKEQHSGRAAAEEDARLEAWLLEAGRQVELAEVEYQAKRSAFQQADSERAAARDAYRADAKNASKSSEWHASVQRAQQAQDAMRAAREALARAQALAELLQKEASGRGLQMPVGGSAAAGAPQPGTKRKRRNAPSEPCPYCTHTYTVRDGLSSKLDAEGNRLHLRRCQCREKTPPCKNCPKCKVVAALMAVVEAGEQQRLCQGMYRCEICACKCPGAGKWVEADEESRKAFATRTEQRFGQLSALGWAGAGAPSTTTAGAGGGSATTAGEAPAPRCAQSHGGSRPSARSLRRLPADIRSELEQAQQEQQELSTADVLRGWSHERRAGASAVPAGAAGVGAGATAGAPSPGRQQGQGQAPAQEQQHDSAQHEGSARHHHHTCSHPHDECTSECCSAPHAPEGHLPHHHLHQGMPYSRGHDHDLPALAAIAVAAQQAQHAGSAPFMAGCLGLGGSDVASAAALQQLVQQMMGVGAGALPSGVAALAQPSPPPELPAKVTALVEEVFLHAAGQHAVHAVRMFLREQRVTSLSDLEYLELSWLCKALQPVGLPPLLLNKFLQMGRKQAAMAAAAAAQQQQHPVATAVPQQQRAPAALGSEMLEQGQQPQQTQAQLAQAAMQAAPTAHAASHQEASSHSRPAEPQQQQQQQQQRWQPSVEQHGADGAVGATLVKAQEQQQQQQQQEQRHS